MQNQSSIIHLSLDLTQFSRFWTLFCDSCRLGPLVSFSCADVNELRGSGSCGLTEDLMGDDADGGGEREREQRRPQMI